VPHDGFACERDRLTPSLVPYVEPAESVRDEYETNSHDYATLDLIPAMVFDDLDPAQADLNRGVRPSRGRGGGRLRGIQGRHDEDHLAPGPPRIARASGAQRRA
jgi:hypothetical protein